MRKGFLIILALLLLFITTSCSDSKDVYDFRKAKWGMSLEDVLSIEASENNTEYNQKHTTAYLVITFDNIEFNGHKTKVEYYFQDKVKLHGEALPDTVAFNSPILVMGKYYFKDEDKNLKEMLYSELETTYGEPTNKYELHSSIPVYRWDKERTEIHYIYVTPPILSMQADSDIIYNLYKKQK
jgi:hypothetical protein